MGRVTQAVDPKRTPTVLPASGVSAKDTPHWGPTFFAIFLAGWGCSFLVGLLADRIGRLKALGIASMGNSLRTIFDHKHRRDTIVLSLIMVPVITGLYGGTLFVPTALTTLHDDLYISMKTPYLIAIGGSIIAGFTLFTCLIVPGSPTASGAEAPWRC